VQESPPCFIFATVEANPSCLRYVRGRSLSYADGCSNRSGGVLCLVLYYLTHVPIHKGDTPKACFSKPRSLVPVGLIIVGLVAALHTLHRLFPKHF
jgi:hypothetical protein